MSVSGVGGPRVPRTTVPQQQNQATREAPKATQAGHSAESSFEPASGGAKETEKSAQDHVNDFKKALDEAAKGPEKADRAQHVGNEMLNELLKKNPELLKDPKAMKEKLDELMVRSKILASTSESQMKSFLSRILEQTKKAFKMET